MDSSANTGRWRWGRDADRETVVDGPAQGGDVLSVVGCGAAAGQEREKGAGKGATELAARFMAKVANLESGCWQWTGATQPNGYGRCKFGDRVALAHRAAYEMFVGPIPAGMRLDHTCRNRGCVNPAHLEPVTQRENTLRGMAPNAMAIRTGKCCRGHARATFGRLRSNGSTECAECQRLFKARWRARNRAMAQAVSS